MLNGKTTGRAKTIPTRRRKAITSTLGSSTFSSSMRTRPEDALISVRSFNRLMQRSNVDFPPPAGPKRTVTAFSGTFKLMLRRDSVPSEYCNDKFSIIILFIAYCSSFITTIVVLPSLLNGSPLRSDSWSIQRLKEQVLYHIGFEWASQGLELKSRKDDKVKPWWHQRVCEEDVAGR